MINLSPIARPYALAAFSCARKKKQLAGWQMFLNSAAYIARQSAVIHLFNNPLVSHEQLFSLFADILAAQLTEERKNFLLLLTQNERLDVLPFIAELFGRYTAALEKISNVKVVTAIDIKEGYRQVLREALAKRMHHEVTLHCEVDASILGGAIIHIGDRVIDGSVRGKLNRLLENIL